MQEGKDARPCIMYIDLPGKSGQHKMPRSVEVEVRILSNVYVQVFIPHERPDLSLQPQAQLLLSCCMLFLG
jgi:hypothetical protein